MKGVMGAEKNVCPHFLLGEEDESGHEWMSAAQLDIYCFNCLKGGRRNASC